jgi:hypothetical protein
MKKLLKDSTANEPMVARASGESSPRRFRVLACSDAQGHANSELIPFSGFSYGCEEPAAIVERIRTRGTLPKDVEVTAVKQRDASTFLSQLELPGNDESRFDIIDLDYSGKTWSREVEKVLEQVLQKDLLRRGGFLWLTLRHHSEYPRTMEEFEYFKAASSCGFTVSEGGGLVATGFPQLIQTMAEAVGVGLRAGGSMFWAGEYEVEDLMFQRTN